MKKFFIPAVAGLIAAGTLAQASLIYDFNDYSDNTGFLNDFAIYRPTSNTSVDFQWANVPGVGGNGTAQLSVAGTPGGTGNLTSAWGGAVDTTMLSKSGFNLNSATGNITISSLFQYRLDNGGGTALTFAQIGLSGNSSVGFNAVENAQFFTTRINRTANNTFTLQYQVKDTATGTNATTGGNVTGINLTAGNWYMLSTTFTKNGTNISGAHFLDNYGTAGTSLVGNMGNSTFSNIGIGTLANDSTTYLGARSLAGSTYIGFDNLSVVPEPTTVAMLVAAGAGGLLYLRGRRRKD